MAPERIELTSGLGVEGPAPVSTAQGLHGQVRRVVGKEVAEKEKDKDDRTDRAVRCCPPTSRLPTYPSSAVSKRWIKIENQSQNQSDDKIKSRTTVGRHIALTVSPETLTEEASKGPSSNQGPRSKGRSSNYHAN